MYVACYKSKNIAIINCKQMFSVINLKDYVPFNYFVAWMVTFEPTGLNFINVLRTAFMLAYPKSVKRYWQLDYEFSRFGDLQV